MVSLCYHDYRHDPFGYMHLDNENTKRGKCRGCFMLVRTHLLESKVSIMLYVTMQQILPLG